MQTSALLKDELLSRITRDSEGENVELDVSSELSASAVSDARRRHSEDITLDAHGERANCARPSEKDSENTLTVRDESLNSISTRIDVYDFFSGCGGTSAGLKLAGLNPVIAVDFDSEALATYKLNFPLAEPILRDIRYLATGEVERHFEKVRSGPILMCACAPCQPFSKQNRQKKASDTRASLLGHLRRFVTRFRPELLLVENVPGIDRNSGPIDNPLTELTEMLDTLGYEYDTGIVMTHDYGVPQSRRRLLVVASLFGPIKLPPPTHGTSDHPHLTVKDAIGNLPPLKAGESDPSLLNHQAAGLSSTNLRRIRASRPGGSWNDWPEELKLPCHEDVSGYTDVYGRMDWKRPAPALTTRCISYSNGRFGHPEQDRAISIREAACLQTFELDFEFVGNLAAMARQIGNAVPVRLAEAVGTMFQDHVNYHCRDSNG